MPRKLTKKKDYLPAKVYFEVVSKLDVKIRTTQSYWNIITKIKHTSIRGKESQVKTTLQNPDIIRKSKFDKNVYLFYKKQNKHYIAVIVRHLNKKQGFIITSYLTRNIMEGKQIWPTRTTKK